VLWEITKLHQLGRLRYGLDHEPLAAALDLRALDFHSDPPDEIIAATSLTHNISLLTRDSRIRKSKAVRLA
jgi:PIN domain nuclease of toxin-antitoxin system